MGNPGQVITNYYTFKNRNVEDEIHVIVNYKDWFRLKENRLISVSDYLTVIPFEFSVKPGGVNTIMCVSRIPEKAVGELVSMIYFNYKETRLTVPRRCVTIRGSATRFNCWMRKPGAPPLHRDVSKSAPRSGRHIPIARN